MQVVFVLSGEGREERVVGCVLEVFSTRLNRTKSVAVGAHF